MRLAGSVFYKVEMFPEVTKKNSRDFIYGNRFLSLLKNFGSLQNEGSSASACWILDAKFRCFSCLTFLFKTIFAKFQKIRKELDVSFQNLLDLVKNRFKQKVRNKNVYFSK